jgi:hypothetical protein
MRKGKNPEPSLSKHFCTARPCGFNQVESRWRKSNSPGTIPYHAQALLLFFESSDYQGGSGGVDGFGVAF